MNKQLDKKIERLEGLKEKEKEKINSINQVLAEYDKQLKVLYDLRKEQEKIYQSPGKKCGKQVYQKMELLEKNIKELII